MSENNYLYLDRWIMPILKEMLVEQNTKVCRLISAFTHAKHSKTKSHKSQAAVVVYVGVTSSQGVRWTPSKMIHRLGKEINNPESICYWAYKVSVPHGVKKRTFEDVASPSSKCHTTQSKTKSKTKELWPLFQNNIPMFSPALTDGALGDMFYLFSADNPGLILDIIEGKKKESLALFCSNYL